MAPKFIQVEPREAQPVSEPILRPLTSEEVQEFLVQVSLALSAVPAFCWLGLWALAINYIGFALMRSDKRRARLGLWRVSEHSLLWPAFMGGALGGKLGQRWCRHKTRKQPFASRLNLAPALNFVAYPLCGWFLAVS